MTELEQTSIKEEPVEAANQNRKNPTRGVNKLKNVPQPVKKLVRHRVAKRQLPKANKKNVENGSETVKIEEESPPKRQRQDLEMNGLHEPTIFENPNETSLLGLMDDVLEKVEEETAKVPENLVEGMPKEDSESILDTATSSVEGPGDYTEQEINAILGPSEDEPEAEIEEEDGEITYLETIQSTEIRKTTLKTETIHLNDDENVVDEEVEEVEVSMSWNKEVTSSRAPLMPQITVDSNGFDWKVLGVNLAPNYMDMEATYKTITATRAQHFSAFKKFNNQIWKHLQLNYQNDQTFSWKMRMRKMLHDFIAQTYADSHLIAVGSTVNGCGSYNSDMDLCLCLQDPLVGYHTDRMYAQKVLKGLSRGLRRANPGLIQHVQYINAKVPIIKLTFHHPYEELEVDLNCNNVAGIYNSHLLHYYARIDDRFPALCLLVKHWAIKHEINDAQSGTFNSYSLILMVLHFLQTAASPPVLPNLQKLYPETFSGENPIEELGLFMNLPQPLPETPKNERTVGELLIAFFDYYARFDFTNFGISVSKAQVFDRWMLPENTQRFKLFIEEPFDGMNTARCVTRPEMFNRIQKAFAITRNAFMGTKAGAPNLKKIRVDV